MELLKHELMKIDPEKLEKEKTTNSGKSCVRAGNAATPWGVASVETKKSKETPRRIVTTSVAFSWYKHKS